MRTELASLWCGQLADFCGNIAKHRIAKYREFYWWFSAIIIPFMKHLMNLQCFSWGFRSFGIWSVVVGCSGASFETSRNTHPATRRHMPEYMNPQLSQSAPALQQSSATFSVLCLKAMSPTVHALTSRYALQHILLASSTYAVDCVWNVMAHAQKPDFVFRRNGRVNLNRRGRQLSRLLAAELCASAVVMLDTPYSDKVWRVLATHSIRQFPLYFSSCASTCAITFQLDSNFKHDKFHIPITKFANLPMCIL